jgi:hypothetical protein
LGIAVANSALDNTAGIMQIPATKNAKETEGPVMPKATPGNTKIPLSIPPILIAMAEGRLNVRTRFVLLFISIEKY